jgi:hypothetical protein
MLMDDKKNRQINNADENAPPETDPAMFNPDADGDQLTGAVLEDDLPFGDKLDEEESEDE